VPWALYTGVEYNDVGSMIQYGGDEIAFVSAWVREQTRAFVVAV
jgi:hypothetical protein